MSLRQIHLAGEVLQVRVGENSGDFDAVVDLAQTTLARLVKLDSPDVKKQILLAVLVLSKELLLARNELAKRQEFDRDGESKLQELISLLEEQISIPAS